MRLQRIYSSKLYVTSTRKDKIHAAMQDPINAELVQQLSDYLDDDAKAELEQAVNREKREQSANQQSSDNSGSMESGSDSSFTPSAGGGSPSSFSGDVFKDFGEDEFAGEDTSDGDMPEDMPAPDMPVEETTSVKGMNIKASTAVIWTTLDDVISDCETIKGTLNSREDTTGVSRLQVKDSELWIYYNDDANLNDKMVSVIEVLNSTGYTYLNFNRLARSNNAIVFDIGLTVEPIKSIKEIEDEV